MLNGKFYTGLTANQMNRTRGPDRQKSSFFWPDETDMVPSPNQRSGRVRSDKPTMSKSVTPSRRMSEEPESSGAKQLFHKQLTSRIEFYDEPTVAKPPQRNEGSRSERQNKSSISNMSSLRRDISDIAEQIDKPRRVNGDTKMEYNDSAEKSYSRDSSNADKPIKSSVSPNEQQRKKITFTEPKQKKGILKNNEVASRHRNEEFTVEQIPSFKKNITPNHRLQLSKSMDNMARLSGTDSQPSKRNNVEHEKTVVRQQKKEHSKASNYEETTDREQYHDDYTPTKPSVRTFREEHHEEDTDGGRKLHYTRHEEAQDDWSDRNGQYHSRSQRSEQHNQHKSVPSNTGRYHREEYTTKNHNVEIQRYEDHRSTPSPPPVENKHRPTNSYRSNDDVGIAKQYANVNEAPGRPSAERSTPNRHQQPSAGSQPSTHQYNNRNYPNEAAVRAQSHLRSNIFFHDSGTSHMDDARPRSVRESAVARVGVGLPN